MQSVAAAATASPLVRRCVNSMMVSIFGAAGITTPLHSGQWLPQPAPDPLARTYAPHSTTSTLYASTPHAKRRNLSCRTAWLPVTSATTGILHHVPFRAVPAHPAALAQRFHRHAQH